MTESETIKHVDNMEDIDKLYYYMDCWINNYFWIKKYNSPLSFEKFCSKSNILHHQIGKNIYKERNFASQSWIRFTPGSIYHSVYLNIK